MKDLLMTYIIVALVGYAILWLIVWIKDRRVKMNENSTPIRALEIERQKWHQAIELARKGKYKLSDEEIESYVKEFNKCDEAISQLLAQSEDKVIASGKLRIERDTQKRFVQAYIVTDSKYISAGELIEEEQAEKYDKQEVTISISKECDDDKPRCSTK